MTTLEPEVRGPQQIEIDTLTSSKSWLLFTQSSRSPAVHRKSQSNSTLIIARPFAISTKGAAQDRLVHRFWLICSTHSVRNAAFRSKHFFYRGNLMSRRTKSRERRQTVATGCFAVDPSRRSITYGRQTSTCFRPVGTTSMTASFLGGLNREHGQSMPFRRTGESLKLTPFPPSL